MSADTPRPGRPGTPPRGSGGWPRTTSTTWRAAIPTSPPSSATTALTTSSPTDARRRLTTERRGLDEFAARLTAIDHARLDQELRVDAAVLGNDVARRLFEIEELREHTWNPLLANPGQAIYMLLARDYAPLPDRLRSLAGRLAAVPGLARHRPRHARADAQGPPGDRDRPVRRDDRPGHRGSERRPAPGGQRRRPGKAAKRRRQSTAALIAEVERARPAALAALAEHRDWLSARLAGDDPAAGGAGFADPRLGAGPVRPQAVAGAVRRLGRRRDPGPRRGRPGAGHRRDHRGGRRARRHAPRGARPAERGRARRGDDPGVLRRRPRRADRLRPRARPGHPLRRPGRGHRHAGDQPGRRGRLLRPARTA